VKKKGSLSVEAVISFTVFLGVSFLLLTLVKLVLVMVILNNAAVETAKTIATAGYPIAMLNEVIEEKGEEQIKKTEPASIEASVKGAGVNAALTTFMKGDTKKAVGASAGSMITDLVGGITVSLLDEAYYSLKGQGVNWLCGQIVKGYVEDCGLNIDQTRLVLRAAKIPERDMEFKTVHSGALNLSESGTLTAAPSAEPNGTDGDFNAADVLICLEYPYEIALPLIPSVTVTLRSVALEHAWVNGTATGPKRTEGIEVNNLLFGKDVYKSGGGAGKCYHAREDCISLLRWKGTYEPQKISYTTARSSGLKPCKICYGSGAK